MRSNLVLLRKLEDRAEISHGHNLRELVRAANLEDARLEEAKKDAAFRNNWGRTIIVRAESLSDKSPGSSPKHHRSDWGQKSRNIAMDKTVLVGGVDFEKGAEILRILDDARLKISVALWVYLPEYEDWRMVLSSRKFDSISLPKAYGLLHDALDAASVPLEKTPPIMIMALSDPFIRSLRRIFGKAKSVDGMRFGGQTIGDRFVDDAYAYRIS